MDCDILVVGAGLLGLSSAYHLKRRNPGERVLVIDRLGGPGHGNSARSEGAFRNVFASETNYLLADSSIDWFTHIQRDLGRDLGLIPTGYLWLLSDAQLRRLEGALETMRRRDVELKTLDKEDLRHAVPELTTNFEGDEEAALMGLEPVDVGVLGAKCGSIDADALIRWYEAEFLRLGGEVGYGTTAERLILKPEVGLAIPGEPFVWQRAQIAGAETSMGTVRAATTVVAAGVWSERLLDPIGVDAFMRAKKRQIFVLKDPRLGGLISAKGLNELDILPLTILPKAGVYLKAEPTEGSIWLGCADNLGRGFGLEDDPQPEEDYYANNIYHILVKYLPPFAGLRPVNMWAGQYSLNSLDMTPVVAPAPGMIYIGAASGSGLMKCDALGRIAAALYAGEEEAELYGGRRFRVADLGVEARRVEREAFVL